MATSLFQSVLKVTHSKMAVCMQVPPIIPPQIPCQDTNSGFTVDNLERGRNIVPVMIPLPLRRAWRRTREGRQGARQLCSNSRCSRRPRTVAIHIQQRHLFMWIIDLLEMLKSPSIGNQHVVHFFSDHHDVIGSAPHSLPVKDQLRMKEMGSTWSQLFFLENTWPFNLKIDMTPSFPQCFLSQNICKYLYNKFIPFPDV